MLLLAFMAAGYSSRVFFMRNKGIFHFNKGEYEKAVQTLEASVLRRPHDYPAAYHLSMAYWKLGDYPAAEKSLARFLKNNSANKKAQKEMAFLQFQRGRIAQSAQLLSSLLADPDGKKVLPPDEQSLAQAIIDYEQGRIYAALNLLEKPRELSTELEAVRLGLLGIACSKIRLYEKSREALESSLKIFGDNPLLLTHLAAISLIRDEYDEASYQYDRARALDFSDADRILRDEYAGKGIGGVFDGYTSPALILRYDTSFQKIISLDNYPLEKDIMSLLPDEEAPAALLFKNARLHFNLTAPASGRYIVDIETRGTPSNLIWPRADVFVNGIFQKRLYIRGKDWRKYSMVFFLTEGANSIDFEYNNDSERLAKGQDRNCLVRRIQITREAQ